MQPACCRVCHSSCQWLVMLVLPIVKLQAIDMITVQVMNDRIHSGRRSFSKLTQETITGKLIPTATHIYCYRCQCFFCPIYFTVHFYQVTTEIFSWWLPVPRCSG